MMQICAKKCPFSSIKHLKKTVKIDVSSYEKCAVSGCAWKYRNWILSVFMHCYECLHDFWTAFWLLLSHFWPFFSHWPWLGLYRPIFGPFWDQNIFILGWFSTIFRVDPGRLTWFLHGSIALIALFKIRFGISTHFSDPNSPKWQIFGVKRPTTAQNAPKRPENGQNGPKMVRKIAQKASVGPPRGRLIS